MALIAAGVGQNNGVLIQPFDGEVGVEKDLEVFSCYGHQGLVLNKVVVWVFFPPPTDIPYLDLTGRNACAHTEAGLSRLAMDL